ncbi:hypothetical protein [Phyllobacterium endophyticum]|uniref:hypothetical protein n=1 Tax=Phyllobacterium endophyticum TaxID=1149773 RepID=UPI0011C7D1F0|nr:hypothetical protein [Phyllobacterium endophyticum]TXR46605.1 hypothetical protein FVA77_24090 [Phyllobacterium endophyticum]
MKRIVVGLLSLLVTACATTSEMPLAQNMVRLDTQASGLLFVGSAGNITMKKAAEATLKRGYTHFRLEQAQTSQGSRLAGLSTYNSGTANATVYGNSAYGNYSGSGFATPVYAPTASVGVTVVMFKAGEAGAKGAIDAADVVKKQGRL